MRSLKDRGLAQELDSLGGRSRVRLGPLGDVENQHQSCQSTIGVVAIGRNEGDRLVRCLKSLQAELPEGMPIVYVDSGSTDGSPGFAESIGVTVLQLDLSVPFTMARGRNLGWRYLVEQHQCEFIQFIDGDCEFLSGWLEPALAALQAETQLAIVCGRRRERFPEASVYNRLADMEWNTPVGEADACGGDALMRSAALWAVGGYNEALIGGEEPEMCARMRRLDWKIRRLELDMTLHDANMLRFGQWWKRAVRGGWAMAAWADLHGDRNRRFWKNCLSNWVWGLAVPIAIVGGSIVTPWALLLLLLYPRLVWKIARMRQAYGDGASESWAYGWFCTLGKWPENLGQVMYWSDRLRGKRATLIEYKGAE
jgi:glycosyltransferase involved in cell wall biosynthesis